jgi:hypothetical protein
MCFDYGFVLLDGFAPLKPEDLQKTDDICAVLLEEMAKLP